MSAGAATHDPRLDGRRVRLEPLRWYHIDQLHEIVMSPELVEGWPCYGSGLTPDGFEALLWRVAPMNFAIVQRETGAVIGAVQGINPQLRNGTIEIGCFIRADLWRAGWPFEALGLVIEYLFTDWEFRKVYFRLRESTLTELGSLLSAWLQLEVRYRAHERTSANRYEDVLVASLRRDDWDSALARRITGRRSEA